jgi:hypothetical protein
MSAIITFMFEPAKLQMNCARASGRINLRAEARLRPVSEGSVATTGFSVIGTHLGVRRQAAEGPHGDSAGAEDQLGDEAGPARLVARAEPGAVVAVEVLVKEEVVHPRRDDRERRRGREGVSVVGPVLAKSGESYEPAPFRRRTGGVGTDQLEKV